MDRIETMRIFTRVAELESFTKTAERLGLPKASVSTAIKELEASLGTRLLQRTTRRVQLTQDGTSFYQRALDLLADLEEAESMFRSEAKDVRGRIRVDMPMGFARNILMPHLPKFIVAHPNLELELSSTDRRVDLIREGFDCVIRAGTLSDSGLIVKPLGQITLINCASPEYLATYGRPKRLDDLRQHRIVRYVQDFGQRDEGLEYFDGEKYRCFRMKGSVTVNNSEAYTAACLAGLGLIQSPRVGLKSYVDEGRLVEVLPKFRAAPMPVSILYANRRHLATRVRLFMDWVATVTTAYLD